jgi:hypothetical protein
MDDDTAFVVGIIIIICIIAVIGYSIYSYFTSINPQAPSIWKFKSNTAVLVTKDPTLFHHNVVVVDMGESQTDIRAYRKHTF